MKNTNPYETRNHQLIHERNLFEAINELRRIERELIKKRNENETDKQSSRD